MKGSLESFILCMVKKVPIKNPSLDHLEFFCHFAKGLKRESDSKILLVVVFKCYLILKDQ